MLLNINDACTIADIVRTAQGNQPVTRLLDGGRVISGTARAIVKDDSGASFLGATDDVRDGYLWVTTVMGFEEFWPMSEVMELVGSGELALNYRA